MVTGNAQVLPRRHPHRHVHALSVRPTRTVPAPNRDSRKRHPLGPSHRGLGRRLRLPALTEMRWVAADRKSKPCPTLADYRETIQHTTVEHEVEQRKRGYNDV